jgi:hypothetical protein
MEACSCVKRRGGKNRVAQLEQGRPAWSRQARQPQFNCSAQFDESPRASVSLSRTFAKRPGLPVIGFSLHSQIIALTVVDHYREALFALTTIGIMANGAHFRLAMVNKQPRQIEHAGHPGDHGDHVHGLDPCCRNRCACLLRSNEGRGIFRSRTDSRELHKEVGRAISCREF